MLRTIHSDRPAEQPAHSGFGVREASRLLLVNLASILVIGVVLYWGYLSDLPETALFSCHAWLLGSQGPVCGLAESMVAFVRGDVYQSILLHRFGVPLMLWLAGFNLVSLILPHAALGMLREMTSARGLLWLGVLFMAAWLLKLTGPIA